MDQDEQAGRRWHWIFHGPDERKAAGAWGWTMAVVVLMGIGGLPYGPVETGEFRTFSVWRWALILAPVVPGLIAIVAWRRHLQSAEEMLKRIYTEAAGLAFAIAVVLFIGIYIAARVFGDADAGNANLLVFTVVLLAFLFTVIRRLTQLNA